MFQVVMCLINKIIKVLFNISMNTTLDYNIKNHIYLGEC